MMKHKSAKSTRNGRGKNSVRRILAGVLVLCMLVTILPGTSLTAGAAEVGNEAVGAEEIVAPTNPDATNPDATNPDAANSDAPNPDATNPDATTAGDDVTKPVDQEDAVTPQARNVTPRAADDIKVEYKVNGGAPQSADSIWAAVGAMANATDPNISYIKLLSNGRENVAIRNGKFTLDLNGKTWDTDGGCTIGGSATHITIKDSGKGGKIENPDYIYGSDVLTVLSGAQLTLNSGTIQAFSNKGFAIYADKKGSNKAGGLITINGGTIKQVNASSVPRGAVCLGTGGFLMNGGTIESDSQETTLLLYGGSNSINGGTIKNTGGEIAVAIGFNGTLDISGGTMTASGSGPRGYAVYGLNNKATIRLSGTPNISGQIAKMYVQNGVSLQANINDNYYAGDQISISYKDVQQLMGTALVTGLRDATQAAKFSLKNPQLSGGTPYDDTKKTIFIGKIPAEAEWTTDGSSWTEGSFLRGVEAMKQGAKDADTSTLRLLNDINTLAEKVTLSSDSTTAYTLDLNGKTLNAANAVWKDYFAIDRGRVDIKDSVGSGQIKGWDNSSAALLRVNNDSTLILKSGMLASSAQGIFVTTGTMRIEGGRIESYDEAVYGSGNCSIDILGGELQSQTTNLITTIGTLRLYGNPKLTAGKDCSTIAAYAAGKIYACSSDGSVSYTGSPVTISCKWDDKKSGDIVVQEVTDPTAAGLFTATDIEPLVLKTPDVYPGNLTLAAKKLTGIAITTPPTKTSYRVGETFDPAGMVVTATYDDKTTEVITTYTVTPSEKLTTSDTTIKVSYTVDGIEKIAEQEITVEAPFTVEFNVDGTVTGQKVYKGEMATKPAVPTKAGYTFKGWFVKGQEEAFDFATPITADITLTAKLVDETAPTDVKILYDENGWKKFDNTATFGLFFKDTVKVKLTATDEGSGVKDFTYTVGDETTTISAKNGAVEFSIAPGYKGNISNVTATDNDNNKSDPAVETEHFAIDKEAPGAPTVDTGTYTSGKWTKDDVTFTLSGASALSGIEKYQYSTNEGKDWMDAAVVTKTDATETAPSNVTVAKVEVKDNCKDVSYIFRAVSNSKIEGTSSEKTEVNIDKVVPTITVNGKTDVYVVDDTAQIVVTAGESKATVEVQKDSGIYTDITTTYEKGYKVTENGTYTFRVTNGAGVTSEASIKYEKIDPRTPVVTIDSGDYKSDTWENKSDITLDVKEDLKHGVMQYKIGDGEWQEYSAPIVISEDCKATVYTFKATSGAGVVSEEKSITVKRDTQVPADVKIAYEKDKWTAFFNKLTFGLFFKETVNVKLTSSDDISGVKEFTYTLKDKAAATIEAKADTTEYTAQFSIEPQYKGSISNVTATDHAGNNSKKQETQHFAVDKEVPVAPTVDTGTYTSGKWTKDDVTFTLSGASALSGIEKYQYSTDGGKSWNDATVVAAIEATDTEPYNITQANVVVSKNCKGVSYIFRAVSNSKIEGTNSKKTEVNIDKVVPTIQVAGKTAVYLVDDTATIAVTAGESKATVEVQKDSGIYTDITTTYEKGYKVTENGTYTFRVTNGAQVTSVASIKYEMIDPRKPVVTIDSGDYKSDTWENKKDITLDVTQDILEHGKIVYKIDETEEWQDYSTPIVISKDCKATVYTFKAISGADVESDEKSITVKRDTTAPTEVEISYEEIGWKKFLNTATFGLFFKDTVKVKMEAKEEGSGIKEFSYTMSGLSITSDAKDNALEFSIKPRFRGNFYYVTATDNAGNTSQMSITQYFAIDNARPTPPRVFTNGYVSGEWAGDTVTFTLSEANAISGIAKYQYSTDGGTTWKDANVVRKIDATQIEPDDVIEAQVEVSGNCKDVGYMFRAVSNVGIESTNSEETKVWIDEVEPVITVTGNTKDYLIKDTAKIAVTTVGESGVTKVEAKKDTGDYVDITASYTKDYEVTENGTYTFRVTNGAGVTSKAIIKYEKIDPRTPVVTIDSGDYKSDTWENKSDITLNVTENLKHGVMQYKIGDGEWQKYSAPIVISEDCKATVYTFKATSGANVVSEEKSITVKRDTQVPSDVKIAYEKDGWTAFLNKVFFGLFFKDTVNVKLTSSDDISGVKEFTYTLKGKDAATIEAKADTTEYTAEFSIEPQYKGSISNVTATDHAENNSKEQETQHFAADKEAPSVPKVDTGTYASGKWTKDDVTFTLSGASALSGIAKYQYSTDEGKSWNDATVVAANDATDTEPYNITQANVVVSKNCKDVSYIFRAVSNSTIEGTKTEKTVVNIDKDVPTIQVTGKTDAYLVDNTATIVVTAGESKVNKVEVKKDSGKYADITTSYKDGYKVTENGVYTFRVTNGANVWAENAITYTMIDSRTPVVTIDSKGYTTDTWKNNGNITLDVTKDLSHGKIEYRIGDGQWQEYSAPIVISKDCKATVYTFKATSGANVVSEEKSITVKRDTTSPDGDITFNKSSVKKFINQISFGLFFKESVDVKLTGTDVTSEVKSIEYTKSNKVLTQAEVMAVGEWTEESEFSLTPVDEEKFIIYVKVTDKAENVFVFGSNGSQFDLTAPAITGVNDKAIYYTTQEAEVKDKNLAEIKLDGNPASSPISLAGDRDCSYVIEAKDKAGNTTSITVVMKPIASLTATIDALTTENVKSSDQTTVNAVKDAVEALISGKATKATKATNATKATKEEQAALQAITDKCEELLTKIEEVATESQRVVDTTDSYRVETVKSTDKEAVETVKTDNETLLATDNLTQEERDALTKVANTIVNLLTKLDQVAVESQRIIDAANSFNVETVKSADKETLETLKAANEALLATENLTEEEREVLTEVTGTIADILTKIEEVATESQRIIDTANSFKLESVKTADREALETLKAANEALQATDSLTEEERGILTEVATAITNLLLKVDQVVAESQRIIDAANGYKVETAKSVDKEALEILKAANETFLATDNLTEKERETLTEVAAVITNILTKLDDVAAEKQRIIDTANSYNVETVKSADKETLETLKAAGEALLATENLMEEERAVLIEANDKINALFAKVDEAEKASKPESYDGVKDINESNVKMTDKEPLIQAKTELEQSLSGFEGNYTEDEKAAIKEKIVQIEKALKAISNAQKVIDAIAGLPKPGDVKKEDSDKIEAAKKLYDSLSEYEKSMIAKAEIDKLTTVVKALEKELNKKPSTVSKAVKTGDNAAPMPYAVSMLLSCIIVLGLAFGKRKTIRR